MKRYAAVISLALAASLTAALPAQAADRPGCVSKAEYAKVENGMTVRQVTRTFDGLHGKTTDKTDMFLDRSYRVCTSKYGAARISWSRGIAHKKYRVGFKTATW